MKRIAIFLLAAVCAMPGALRAQDAAVQEQLDKLNARIEVLTEALKKQDDRIMTVEKELSALQRQNKPGESSASAEELKRLAEQLKEVDRRRMEDHATIIKEIEKLGRKPVASLPKNSPPSVEPSNVPSTGFEYVIQSGDTLSVIVAAYKEKNIKVTVDQILKANPGLKPDKLKVGQKIFVPAPAQ